MHGLLKLENTKHHKSREHENKNALLGQKFQLCHVDCCSDSLGLGRPVAQQLPPFPLTYVELVLKRSAVPHLSLLWLQQTSYHPERPELFLSCFSLLSFLHLFLLRLLFISVISSLNLICISKLLITQLLAEFLHSKEV